MLEDILNLHIMRPKNLNFLAAIILLMGITSCNHTDKQPNIVFILVDDLGWADVSPNNPGSFYETPNLEILATEGMKFTNAYASCPVCSPTRASIMTGKSPARLHITDWIPGRDPKDCKLLGPKDKHQLDLEEITIAEALKEQGYTTCHIGKWHLGPEEYYPENQGFDFNFGGWHKGSPGRAGYYSPYENPRLPDGPEGEFLTERLTNEALSFIEENQDKPFYLNLAFYTVHTPIEASKEHIEYFLKKKEGLPVSDQPASRIEHDGVSKLIQDNAQYASMVFAMDENVGRVMDKLKELELDDNTFVFFTSDNGGLSTLYNRGYPTSNLPLRAGKGWCYEGGIRVPLIVSGPGIGEGMVSDYPVTSMDYYPTILQLLGLPEKAEQHVDGIDLKPFLLSASSIPTPPRTLYWFYPHYHGSAWEPGAAIRVGDWKLIEFYDDQKVELYNLSSDLEEQNDLSEKFPDKVDELQDMLRKILYDVDADMPENNPEWGEI